MTGHTLAPFLSASAPVQPFRTSGNKRAFAETRSDQEHGQLEDRIQRAALERNVSMFIRAGGVEGAAVRKALTNLAATDAVFNTEEKA